MTRSKLLLLLPYHRLIVANWHFKLWKLVRVMTLWPQHFNEEYHFQCDIQIVIPKFKLFSNESLSLIPTHEEKILWFMKKVIQLMLRYVEDRKEVPCMDPERIIEAGWNHKLLNSCPQTSFGLLGNLYCYKRRWETAKQGGVGRAEVDFSGLG